ncbi:MAG: hypothetical protein C0613_14205 [Desulfobulbaceae bacterium]|nr:MAG: hypothetical protein C0613_14205 [Desulfobulbaceae bacterium]
MFVTNPFKTALLISVPVAMIILFLSACSVKSFAEPLWKSVVCYNKSPDKITVTSVTGIRAYAKGHGPQNLIFGKLKANGYAAMKSMGYLYLKYPIEIKWVNRFSDDHSQDLPTNLVQEIRTIYGVEDGRTEFSEDMSLILVFNGAQWAGYYAPKSSLLKKDINSIIESYSNSSK